MGKKTTGQATYRIDPVYQIAQMASRLQNISHMKEVEYFPSFSILNIIDYRSL